MALVLRRRAGQQIKVTDRLTGRFVWIEVYRRSPHTTDLDFCFRDPENNFSIDRAERLGETVG